MKRLTSTPDVDTGVDTDVDLKLLPHSRLIDIEYKVMEG